PGCLPDPFSLTLVMQQLELSTRLSQITIRMVTRVQADLVTALMDLTHQRANPRMPQLVEPVDVSSRGVCRNEIESTANSVALTQSHDRGKIIAGVSSSVSQLHLAPAPDPPQRPGEVATVDEITGAALQHPQCSHERMLERPVNVVTEHHPEAVLPTVQLRPEIAQALPQDFNVLVDNRTIDETLLASQRRLPRKAIVTIPVRLHDFLILRQHKESRPEHIDPEIQRGRRMLEKTWRCRIITIDHG